MKPAPDKSQWKSKSVIEFTPQIIEGIKSMTQDQVRHLLTQGIRIEIIEPQSIEQIVCSEIAQKHGAPEYKIFKKKTWYIEEGDDDHHNKGILYIGSDIASCEETKNDHLKFSRTQKTNETVEGEEYIVFFYSEYFDDEVGRDQYSSETEAAFEAREPKNIVYMLKAENKKEQQENPDEEEDV